MKALLQCWYFTGCAIARYHNLLLGVIQRIKCVEELFLSPFLACEELDVVHQQDVDGSVPFPEIYSFVVPYGIDQLVHELFRRNIGQAERRIAASDQVSDRVHQVSLPKTHPSV